MAEKPKPDEKKSTRTPSERDEPVKIDLDPETALRGLLKVDPEAEPTEPSPDDELRAYDAE